MQRRLETTEPGLAPATRIGPSSTELLLLALGQAQTEYDQLGCGLASRSEYADAPVSVIGDHKHLVPHIYRAAVLLARIDAIRTLLTFKVELPGDAADVSARRVDALQDMRGVPTRTYPKQ